jgi:putative phosphoribosyl transferase
MAEVQRFSNRAQAGKLLAKALGAWAQQPEAIVLALPRGGVPVAFAVAMTLGLELDVLLVRKLGLPGQPEFAIGAVGSGGVQVLQPGVPGLMGVTQEEVDAIAARELLEIERRTRLYRGGRAPPVLADRPVIIVDDTLPPARPCWPRWRSRAGMRRGVSSSPHRSPRPKRSRRWRRWPTK